MTAEQELFHWRVQLQRSDGRMSEKLYASYWDPEREGAAQAAAEACAAEASHFEGGRVRQDTGEREFKFAGLTAIHLEADQVDAVRKELAAAR